VTPSGDDHVTQISWRHRRRRPQSERFHVT